MARQLSRALRNRRVWLQLDGGEAHDLVAHARLLCLKALPLLLSHQAQLVPALLFKLKVANHIALSQQVHTLLRQAE